MTPTTRTLALRAAAKVALAGAIFGCEKAPQVNAETSTAEPKNEARVAATTTATAATSADTPRAAPGTCNVHDEKAPTKAELACCADSVRAASTDGGVIAAPDTIACCKALANDNDAKWSASHGNQDMPARGACCRALNWQGSMTCTPWGPPVPPAMDWVA